jgi:hypothetical protein
MIPTIIGSILGSIIVILLSQLIFTIQKLSNKVQAISELLAVSSNKVDNMKEACYNKHTTIETRLNDHSKRIGSLEIKTKDL